MTAVRVAVVGAGIVGLAVAREVARRRPSWDLVVLEKEPAIGRHQTAHNSGVVHAGVYYPPGSAKARLCRRGVGLLTELCDEHGVVHRRLGKLVVAVDASERGRLEDLHARSLANGVPDVELLGPAGIRDVEPFATGVGALHSPTTEVVDFLAVAEAIAGELCAAGVAIRCSAPVTGVRRTADTVELTTPAGPVVADHVVVCAGLHASRMARLVGDEPDPRIVPFRGEYHVLDPPSADLVRGMIYPVPDPALPFLGVHLTRHVDDVVDIGPNAVLATALEGYRWRDVSPRDLASIASWPGTWRLARAQWRTGLREVSGSLRRRAVVAAARRYVPALSAADVRRGSAGVRAQAVGRDGSMVDDFRVTTRDRITSVRNAPSPAATSSLAIAEHVADVLSW